MVNYSIMANVVWWVVLFLVVVGWVVGWLVTWVGEIKRIHKKYSLFYLLRISNNISSRHISILEQLVTRCHAIPFWSGNIVFL